MSGDALGVTSREAAQRILTHTGIATRRALLSAGVHRRWLERRVAGGELIELLPGVLAGPDIAQTLHLRIHAALLFAGPDAAASHRTAAYLWGLGPAPTIRDPIHVAIPHGRGQRDPGTPLVVVHQRHRDPVMLRQGWPVVPVPETLAMMAPDTPEDDLRMIAMEAIRLGLIVPDDLREARWRRSSRLLGLLAEEADAGAVAGGEAKYWRLLKTARLHPMPHLNAAVHTPRGCFFVDALWRDLGLGAEIDGRSVHALQHAFEADRARQNALHTSGIMLIRFPVSQVLGDGPTVVHETLEALRSRALELGRPLPRTTC